MVKLKMTVFVKNCEINNTPFQIPTIIFKNGEEAEAYINSIEY